MLFFNNKPFPSPTKCPQKISRTYDVIVIGSGMGGLSCGAALARVGKRVLILEKHYVAGGMTHTFSRKNKFTFDVGVHALGEMQETQKPGKILKWLSQGKIEMCEYGHPYETFIFPKGIRFEYPNSQKEYLNKLIQTFPTEKKSIEKYFDMINQVGKCGIRHFISKLLPAWLETLVAPIFLRKVKTSMNITLKEVLESLFKNDQLKAILSAQWGYYGATPSMASFFIHALTTRHFWEGAFYPQGGGKVLAPALIEPIIANGGEIKLKYEVKELLMNKGKACGVLTHKGEKFYAPKIISAIGAQASVARLLPHNYKKTLWAQSIHRLKQSPCHVCLYLGFEEDISNTEATASNQWWYRTWDFEKSTWNVNDPHLPPPILYVSFPTLKVDPQKMKESFPQIQSYPTAEVVTFVPWESFSRWKDTHVGRRGDDYKEFKKNIEERMLKEMQKNMPQLMKKCTFHELSTPLSTTHYCSSPQGAIYGIAPTPQRWRTQALRPKSPLPGFYLTGSDIGTLGVVGAMLGGVLTATRIDRKVLAHVL